MCQSEGTAQFSTGKPSYLKNRHYTLLRIGKRSKQHGVSRLVAQGLCSGTLLSLALDVSIMPQHVGFLRTVPFLLYPRRLVVKTVFLGRHHEGEQGIDNGTLSRSVGSGKQGIVSLGFHTENLLVKGSPVVYLHILQTESRCIGTGTKQTQHIPEVYS